MVRLSNVVCFRLMRKRRGARDDVRLSRLPPRDVELARLGCYRLSHLHLKFDERDHAGYFE